MNILVTYRISLFLRHHWLEFASFYLSLRKTCCQLDCDTPSFIKRIPISEQLICGKKMWVLEMIDHGKAHQWVFLSSVQLNKATINHIQLQIHLEGYRNRNTISQEGRVRHFSSMGLECTTVWAAFTEPSRCYSLCSSCPLSKDSSGAKGGDSHRGAESTLV